MEMSSLYNDENIVIFQDTLKETQNYINETADAIADSILYDVNDTRYTGAKKRYLITKVKVVKATTVGEALRIKKKHPSDKVCVLNFASAKHPGGGVLKGSMAQEECICRCSNLYSILSDEKFKKNFYDYHKYTHSKLYTSKLIYSPDVLFLRNDEKDYIFLDDAVKVDVITCAAPNLRSRFGGVDFNITRNNDMPAIYYDRIKHIFMAAATNNVDHLVLGAFGCGVFKNSPNEIARAFHEVQDEFHGSFKSVTYAIYCGTDKTSVNFDVFNTEFK